MPLCVGRRVLHAASMSADASIPPAERSGRAGVQEVRASMAEAHRAGLPGTMVARRMADGVEQIVVAAFARAGSRQPLAGASLLALGGFGRQELAPYSDVDLLLLVPEQAGDVPEKLAHELFTPMWDAGLEPGTALRTQAQALDAAADDHTIATALLDARVIAGDPDAGQRLLHAFWERLQGDRREAFIQAKVSEIAQRRARFGGSVYLLEPNLKTGVGGLRDLAGGLWVARARHRLDGLAGVAHFGLLPRREIEALRAARDTLFRLRCELHLVARRRDDRLTFAAQEQVAKALGYEDTPQALGVELLMRDYYLAAQVVEHATDALVDRCTHEAQRRGFRRAQPLDDWFEQFDGRVTLRERASLADQPALLVDLFVTAERERVPVASAARDLVAHEVERRADALAACGPALRAFLAYLESPGANGQALRGMYETGLLGGLLPEFARLRARVQHDVYHVFTVDTHTLFALQKMLRLRAGLLAAEQPVFTRLVQDLPRPLPLYVGLFFHDLGKGLGGDHAVRGEALVRAFAARTGALDAASADDAAFLVREHLKLSQVAFRRDLSDPALVQSVAELVGSRERLDMLYLLTYVDISSVGPETWNEWRSRLLGELYEKVRAHLDAALAEPDRPTSRTEAAQAGARAIRALVRPSDGDLDRFLKVLPERYLATVPPPAARQHFELWKRAKGRTVTGAAHPRPDAGDASELVVVAEDRPGLLSLIAGALAAHSIDILGAEIFSLADGRALDAFLVREPGGIPPSAERVARALADLERILCGEETVQALLARRRGPSRLFAPGPATPTKIRFDLAAARDATVVDVYTRDRVGLLHDIAAAIHREGASIVLARVATEGNRATDGFYLQDAGGRKITDPARLAALERALHEALAAE